MIGKIDYILPESLNGLEENYLEEISEELDEIKEELNYKVDEMDLSKEAAVKLFKETLINLINRGGLVTEDGFSKESINSYVEVEGGGVLCSSIDIDGNRSDIQYVEVYNDREMYEDLPEPEKAKLTTGCEYICINSEMIYLNELFGEKDSWNSPRKTQKWMKKLKRDGLNIKRYTLDANDILYSELKKEE